MNNEHLIVKHSPPLSGTVEVSGAKNAVLVIMASILLTRGRSILRNVPGIADVYGMAEVLRSLGAEVLFNQAHHELIIDTTGINASTIDRALMQKMRASVLVMGPLLATQGNVSLGLPGGCGIGARPIDYHLKNFATMGVGITYDNESVIAHAQQLRAARVVLEYPSVGATENILMLATRISGITEIINASLEPEVMDVIEVLKKMGACIQIEAPATIRIEGVTELNPIEHSIMPDRLEAGSLLIAIAATGGHIYLPNVDRPLLDVFLLKLEEMGHSITTDGNGKGIRLRATKTPCAVSFKTAPFPGFPTDLQSPMMALQCTAEGKSIIEETVFENRFMHVPYLQKMGAKIEVHGNKAVITGVVELHGTSVVATDIRASMALVVAGLMAQGTTSISKIHHWRRGYDGLENKLHSLGAHINLQDSSTTKNCPIIL